MMLTVLLTITFAALLALEWRYRLKSVRIMTAVLALVVWSSLQPNLAASRRRAVAMPPGERVTTIAGRSISEYESGVFTLSEVIADDVTRFEKESLLAVIVILWLACSPLIPRSPRPSDENDTDDRPKDAHPGHL